MAVNISGAPTSETIGKIGDHLVDSTTGKVYECISVNTYGGHDAVTFKRKKTEYVWKCIGDDPNYGSELPSGGTPYQQLVTDGNGNAKWEDRLAYDDSKVAVDVARGAQFIKVSDEVPSWASIDAPIKYWESSGNNGMLTPENYIDIGNGSFVEEAAAFITTDNSEFNGIVFPEKGIYFLFVPDALYITGIASADSDTPEIVWDGNVGFTKTIDQKYIPSQRFDVTLSEDGDGNLVSDKTPAEILEAYNNGQIVNGIYDNIGINLLVVGLNNDVAAFTATDADNGIVKFYGVKNDRTVVKLAYSLVESADNLPNGLILTTINGVWWPSDSLVLPSTNFVLPSSTSGSTKKFKITVDDSGTISATEVT